MLFKSSKQAAEAVGAESADARTIRETMKDTFRRGSTLSLPTQNASAADDFDFQKEVLMMREHLRRREKELKELSRCLICKHRSIHRSIPLVVRTIDATLPCRSDRFVLDEMVGRVHGARTGVHRPRWTSRGARHDIMSAANPKQLSRLADRTSV